ncbi:MAG: ABC transporter substrate-binding protein [Planctomycetia bacterium]|nr:ABC transporter substrate-binding protein [Planctomycetia bacterium]
MKIKIIILASLIFFIGCSNQKNDPKLTFGTLPVIQALPIFVADDLGLFQKYGVNIDVIPFNSALESEIAISAKQIDGYFADIITPMILKANNTELQIVSTLFKTDNHQRMFALLAPPNSENLSIKEIAENGIAVSTNTVIDYITPYLLKSVDSTVFNYNKIDTKKIPIRLQLLLQNQVPAAVLPEPLASFAEQKGAIVIADDRMLNLTPTVAVFTTNFLTNHSKNTKGFLLAIAEAIRIINQNPAATRNIMLNNCQVPDLIKNTFPVPKFPQLALPSEDNILNAYKWLSETNIISTKLDIEDLLSDEYLP